MLLTKYFLFPYLIFLSFCFLFVENLPAYEKEQPKVDHKKGCPSRIESVIDIERGLPEEGRVFCPKEAFDNGTCEESDGDFRVLAVERQNNGVQSCETKNFRIVCTATRLSKNWAITAKHCVRKKIKRNKLNLSLSAMGKRVFFKIEDILPADTGLDIALLKIDASLDPWFDTVEAVTSADLIQEDTVELDTWITIYGYGYTGKANSQGPRENLMRAEMSLQSVSDSKWCLGCENDIKKPKLCGGDSGSPVFLFDTNNMIGVDIEKNDRGCDKDASPKAFAVKIAQLCEWISSKSKGEVQCKKLIN